MHILPQRGPAPHRPLLHLFRIGARDTIAPARGCITLRPRFAHTKTSFCSLSCCPPKASPYAMPKTLAAAPSGPHRAVTATLCSQLFRNTSTHSWFLTHPSCACSRHCAHAALCCSAPTRDTSTQHIHPHHYPPSVHSQSQYTSTQHKALVPRPAQLTSSQAASMLDTSPTSTMPQFPRAECPDYLGRMIQQRMDDEVLPRCGSLQR